MFFAALWIELVLFKLFIHLFLTLWIPNLYPGSKFHLFSNIWLLKNHLPIQKNWKSSCNFRILKFQGVPQCITSDFSNMSQPNRPEKTGEFNKNCFVSCVLYENKLFSLTKSCKNRHFYTSSCCRKPWMDIYPVFALHKLLVVLDFILEMRPQWDPNIKICSFFESSATTNIFLLLLRLENTKKCVVCTNSFFFQYQKG